MSAALPITRGQTGGDPVKFEGQIEGSVHMGLGYALTEELRLENGAPQKYDLRSLHILRAKDSGIEATLRGSGCSSSDARSMGRILR